ncbi:lanthionine synthetase-like protein [Chitinophaga dinghuensis]|uniref:Lanthionine synthetase-like protein n=1 Tax=Chitinophaga dinghuensis TaxID=1539050 RepID=A0A327VWF2_9BACT|nr:lanthionine synthetase C family protein [Chitinophaga dinghuensis]RAJ80331.1 lanthionine synthetase-like protein [Chitinophaga dinghuensis]
MDDKKLAAAILEDISTELTQFAAEGEYPGLLGGYSGTALFFANYYQLTGKESHLDLTYTVIQRSLDAISTMSLSGGHCSGLSGIAWHFLHLAEMGYIDPVDLDETFGDLDTTLAKFMQDEIQIDKMDFLHQGLGVALYFLARLPSPAARQQLEQLVAALAQHAHKMPAGIAWRDQFSTMSLENEDRNMFNLGLAHGNPAIISVLSRIYEKGIAQDIIPGLIGPAVDWLLTTRKATSAPGTSLFPVLIDDNGETAGDVNSRLGWCYGDLGIAQALLDAGERMQKSDWLHYSAEMFTQIATTRDIKNGAVHDACLCHGSAGIALMMQQAGIRLQDNRLLQNAAYWYQTVASQNTWTDGPAGYKFYHYPNYVSSHNVLEGISGIGLSLIHFLEPDIKPTWASAMLIG